MRQKKIFYEVNPLYFKDDKNQGIGNFKGLVNKVDYFSFLGIDNLILSEITSIYFYDKSQEYKKVISKLGSLAEFKEFVDIFKKKNQDKKIFVQIDLGMINKKMKWLDMVSKEVKLDVNNLNKMVELKNKNTHVFEYKYDPKTKSYYLVNKNTVEINFEKENNKFLIDLEKQIRF
jgi:hypothetical protein